MTTTDRARVGAGTTRCWKIVLTSGREIEARGRRVLVADGGSLLVLTGPDLRPTHLFGPAAWTECIEQRTDSPRR